MESVSRDRLTRMYVSSLPLLHSGNKMLHVSLQAAGSVPCPPNPAATHLIITSDKGGGTCFCPCSFVCLSVSEITQKRVHGFAWNVRDDRCRDMDNWLTFQPDPHYSPDAGTALLSPISYKRCNTEFYYVGKMPRMLSKWFYSPRSVGTPSSEIRYDTIVCI